MLRRLLCSRCTPFRISQHPAVSCCNNRPALSCSWTSPFLRVPLWNSYVLASRCCCARRFRLHRNEPGAPPPRRLKKHKNRSQTEHGFRSLNRSLHDVSRFFVATSLTRLTRRSVYAGSSRFAPLDRFFPFGQPSLPSLFLHSLLTCLLIALQVDLIRARTSLHGAPLSLA